MTKKPKNRGWEKDRRDRLNVAFTTLSKLLPCYDPSRTLSKIDILTHATTFIEELQEKVDGFINSEKIKSTEQLEIKRLTERVKKLLTRNDQLCNFIRDAGIKIPKEYGTVKGLSAKFRWSNKISAEQANKLAKKDAQKNNENNDSKVAERKKQHKVRLLTKNPKTQKKARRKLENKKTTIHKQNLPLQLPLLNCTQNGNIPIGPCYMITNTSAINLTAKCDISKNNDVSKSLPKSVSDKVLNILGPGTLILANGTVIPVASNRAQSQKTISPLNNPIPLVLNQFPITTTSAATVVVVSASNKVEVSKISCISTLSNVGITTSISIGGKILPQIRPKRCITKTTQVNKVPIPALSSRYSNFNIIREEEKKKISTTEKKESNKKNVKMDRSKKKNLKKCTNKRKSDSKIDNENKRIKTAKQCEEISKNDKESENEKTDCPKEANIVLDESENVEKENIAINAIQLTDKMKPIEPVKFESNNTFNTIENIEKLTQLEAKETENETFETEKHANLENQEKSNATEEDSFKREEGKQKETEKNEEIKTTLSTLKASENCPKDQEEKSVEDTNKSSFYHSELSNDIFSSLQVPLGSQNQESTSPTAAFLLAFPLVSTLTGVKVTEVIDEENSDSRHGTPTLLQIGTMDSTKTTQTVPTESLTPNLLNLDSFSFFSTKDSCTGFYNSFDSLIYTSCQSTVSTNSTFSTASISTPTTTFSSFSPSSITSTMPNYSSFAKVSTNAPSIPSYSSLSLFTTSGNLISSYSTVTPVSSVILSTVNTSSVTPAITSYSSFSSSLNGPPDKVFSSVPTKCSSGSVKKFSPMSTTSLTVSALNNYSTVPPTITSYSFPTSTGISAVSSYSSGLANTSISTTLSTYSSLPLSNISSSVPTYSSLPVASTVNTFSSVIPTLTTYSSVPKTTSYSSFSSVSTTISNYTSFPTVTTTTVVTASGSSITSSNSNKSIPEQLAKEVTKSNQNVKVKQENMDFISLKPQTNDKTLNQTTTYQAKTEKTLNNSCSSNFNTVTANKNLEERNQNSTSYSNNYHSFPYKNEAKCKIKLESSIKQQLPNSYSQDFNQIPYVNKDLLSSNHTPPVTTTVNCKFVEHKPQVNYNTNNSNCNTFNPFADKLPGDCNVNYSRSYGNMLYGNNSTNYNHSYPVDSNNYYSSASKTNPDQFNQHKGATVDQYSQHKTGSDTFNSQHTYNSDCKSSEVCKRDSNVTSNTNNYFRQKEKVAVNNTSNKNVKQGNQNLPKPPINWMTTPDLKQDSAFPTTTAPFVNKEMDYATNNFYPSTSFSTRSSCFNTNPTYQTPEFQNVPVDNKKSEGTFPIVPHNPGQRNEFDENQFSWSPTKLPQFFDTPHSFVSSTLPTLVGDLALGSLQPPGTVQDQTKDKESIKTKEVTKRNKQQNYDQSNNNNHSNFLSVSQLVEKPNDGTPARITTRRNSGSRSTKNIIHKSVRRGQKQAENKECVERVGRNYTNQNSKVEMPVGRRDNSKIAPQRNQTANYGPDNASWYDYNKNQRQELNKTSQSIYSAEALLGPQVPQNNTMFRQQPANFPANTKSLAIPNFLSDNIMPYFTSVDLQDNNFMQQNQNFQTTALAHNFSNTVQSYSYLSNTSTANISSSYLPTTSFISELNGQEYSTLQSNAPTQSVTKIYPDKSSNKQNSSVQNSSDCAIGSSVNYGKKSSLKMKQSTENSLPGIVDFSFLSMPGTISSPMLPDDFHVHTNFLPPPAPAQLYPCKNPPYNKQGPDLPPTSMITIPPMPASRNQTQNVETPNINNIGTSLTNFNLSAIFPEINKGNNFPTSSSCQRTIKSKEYSLQKNCFQRSTNQVPFQNKPSNYGSQVPHTKVNN